VAPARDALLSDDWDALGELMTRNRELARGLGGGAISDRMDALFDAGHAVGVLGAKPCGAGGGGYLLFLVTPERRDAVAQALGAAGGRTVAVRIAARRDGASS
jgi:D-glycero-alpha-D-manno-heptose-7-phosphate kinase